MKKIVLKGQKQNAKPFLSLVITIGLSLPALFINFFIIQNSQNTSSTNKTIKVSEEINDETTNYNTKLTKKYFCDKLNLNLNNMIKEDKFENFENIYKKICLQNKDYNCTQIDINNNGNIDINEFKNFLITYKSICKDVNISKNSS